MTSFPSDPAVGLAALLATVQRPGDFVASGTAELMAPSIEVEGVGPVALPLLPVQAEQLIAAAERAPYGRGPQTLYDTTVRRTWQIDAARVRIGGKHWQKTLDGIVERAAEGLGVADPVSADLYKLLVYAEGDFFVGHRDTEKDAGMFATLVIVLPCLSSGGELVVTHKGRSIRLDLRTGDPSEVAFAAFYADCMHEVLPVTAGHRLTLIYNLVRSGPGRLPQPPDYAPETERVAALLKNWATGEGAPRKLVYPLEHAYTQAELGFAALKGADAAVAGVLAAAAPAAGCDLHLALLSIDERGAAEYAGDYRRRWGEPDDDAFEAGEVFERVASLSDWRRPDGTPLPLAAIPVEEEDELSPPGVLEDAAPDEESFQEATGNAGASFERSYRRAALVLWPCAGFFVVLSQGGPGVTLPYLETLVGQWEAAGGDLASPMRGQASALARAMLADWPGRGWYGLRSRGEGGHGRFLALLVRLGDTDGIAALLNRIADGDDLDSNDAAAVTVAAGALDPEQGTALIGRIVNRTVVRARDACCALLWHAATSFPPERRGRFTGAAEALFDALPGGPAKPPSPLDAGWGRSTAMTPGPFANALGALGLIAPALADRMAERVLDARRSYDLDRVVLPAVTLLLDCGEVRGLAAVERLRDAVVAHLRARAAEPLDPPKDLRRASALPCKCPQCRELAAFLDDPVRDRWALKAAEQVRGHVEDVARRAKADVDLTTERKGRPYSLIAVKNQASFERRVEQRRQDMADLDRLF